MVFKNIASALLNLNTVTALYISKDSLVFECGPIDTVLENQPDGTVKVHTKGGPHVCSTEAEICAVIGLDMAAAPTPEKKPATKKKTPAATKTAATKPA